MNLLDTKHDENETRREFEALPIKESRVKKTKQVIATGNALLRFTETLPHHAYHKINQKIESRHCMNFNFHFQLAHLYIIYYSLIFCVITS